MRVDSTLQWRIELRVVSSPKEAESVSAELELEQGAVWQNEYEAIG